MAATLILGSLASVVAVTGSWVWQTRRKKKALRQNPNPLQALRFPTLDGIATTPHSDRSRRDRDNHEQLV